MKSGIVKLVYKRFVQSLFLMIRTMDIDMFTAKYILRELPSQEIAALSLMYYSPVFDENLLKNKVVLNQTVVILALIESAKNLKQFEELYQLYKNRLNNEIEEKRLHKFDMKLEELMTTWELDRIILAATD